MLKLRNAVLTALLAFCLAMPFVSCSFNDGATGDVSGEVKVQSDNNQNGGNGGSTGGNEKPSGGDEDSGDNGNENPSGGNNGGSGNENPSGGNGGSTGENETPSGGNENPSGGNEKPGEGTVYTVKYGDTVIASDMSESALSHFVQTYGLVEDTDYTIDGAVITLTESGYNKVTSEMPGEGDEPVPDVPVPDVPGDVEGTMYTVMYNGAEIKAISASELSYFETVLTAGTDYTISETVITLTESGFNKLLAADSGAGE